MVTIWKFRRFWGKCIDTILRGYCEGRDSKFKCEAGFACGWFYPYGFVPEADCPEHDKW